MKIDISEHQRTHYENRPPTEARLLWSSDWTNEEGESIDGGSDLDSPTAYRSVEASLADGVVTIAPFTDVDCNVINSVHNGVTATLALYDADGYIETVYNNLKISDLVSPATWANIDEYSNSKRFKYSVTLPTWEKIYQYLSQITSATTKATSVALGILKLRTPAANILNPIAVGDNDTRLVDNLANHSNSLATAVSNIAVLGNPQRVLTINSEHQIEDNLVVPANITLDFQNGGMITVYGCDLSVGSMRDPGNRKVFDVVHGGQIYFADGSVPYLNTAWLAGQGDVDITDAMRQFLTSIAAAGGTGNIYTPHVAPELGEISLDSINSLKIFGNGNSPDGTAGYGTSLQLKSGSSYMFKIGENRSAIRFEDITLYGGGAGTGVLCEGTGGDGTTSVDISFTNVTFHSFAEGFNHHSLGSSWQLAQTAFYQCYWINCAKSFISNSINGSFVFKNPTFQIPHYGVALDIQMSPPISIENYEFHGSLKTKTFTSSNVNTGTDTINLAAHGFADDDEVQVLSDGTRPVTSPANGLNSIAFIDYIDANNFKFKDSNGTTINLTSGGSGTHTIYRRSSKVCVISGSHGTINFLNGGQDEACLTFVENNGSDINGLINVDNCLIQSKFQLNESCQVNVKDSNIFCDTFQGAPDLAYVSIDDCNLSPLSVIDGQTVNPLRVSQMTGGGQVIKQNIARVGHFIQRFPNTVYTPMLFDGSPDTPVQVFGYETGISETKNIAFFGLVDSAGNPLVGHYLRRIYATGILDIYGNQAYPNNGISFNGGSPVTKELFNAASLNFPSIAAGATAELTVTVTGAVVGNVAWASPNTSIEAGLGWAAYVSATNTVTIRLWNVTASPIDPAAKSWSVWVRI